MKYLCFLYVFSIFFVSCNNAPNENEAIDSEKSGTASTFSTENLKIEIDDSTVQIGNQTWMRYNLNVDRFQNGDPVNYAENNPAWQKLGDQALPAMGYYLNNPENGKKYGAIYNWYAVADERGLCSEGWSIPTDDDWNILVEYLGGEDIAGKYLKDSLGWGAGGNGNNLSGFSAVPGGFRGYDGLSYFAEYMGRWWTSTEQSEFFAMGRDINHDQEGIASNTGYKLDGFSVRCIRK